MEHASRDLGTADERQSALATTRRRLRWALLAAGSLALVLVAIGAARPAGPALLEPPERPYAWLCDRDADQLVAVDSALIPLAVVAAPCPVRVRARSDGSCFAVLSHACGVDGRHDLAIADAGGGVGRLVAFDPVRDLELAGDDALVLEGAWSAASARLWLVEHTGVARQLGSFEGASAVAAHDQRYLVGTTQGEVLLLDRSHAVRAVAARAELGAEVADIVPAPDGGWWVLCIGAVSTVWRLDGALGVAWERSIGGAAQDLAAPPDTERVFVPHSGAAWLSVLGEGGRVLFDQDLGGLGELDRGDGDPRGGALLAAPGFAVRFDRHGNALVSQGGFDRLFDLSIVPP